MSQIDRIPGVLPTSPNGNVAPSNQGQISIRPPGAPRARSGTADWAAAEIDPVTAIAEVIAEIPPLTARPGLADQLLEYVRPRLSYPEALTPPRLIPLLSAAADHVSRATEADEIAHLGATALGQELRRHRDLAERRATLLGAGAPES